MANTVIFVSELPGSQKEKELHSYIAVIIINEDAN